MTVVREPDGIPRAPGRLLVCNNQLMLHCTRLQLELVQTKEALSESLACLDMRSEEMLRLDQQKTAAQAE